MKRSDQSGDNAPNRGTMIKQSSRGVAAFDVAAIDRYPPPSFLTPTQTNLWVASLSDVPLEFFRARHIPIMIQYVRAVEKMMLFSDQFEADPDNVVALSMWERMIRMTTKLERQLSFHTEALISVVTRARGEMRLANQMKKAKEAGTTKSSTRTGLIYVGH